MRKKVLLVGPILTQSGYGEHARTIFRALKDRADLFDLYVNPVNWGATSWLSEDNDERRYLDFLINKTFAYMQQRLPFDLTVMVTIPTEWQQYRAAPENIGVCAGIESDKVSPHWINAANNFVDKVVVPSSFSKDIFINTTWDIKDQNGVEKAMAVYKPVEYVNFAVEKEFVNPSDYLHKDLKFKHDFNFLCVAQWGPRKNIKNTIKHFLEEFKDDEVGLVLKLTIKDGSTIDYYETQKRISKLLSEYEDRKCSVELVHGTLSKEEMSSLLTHPQIKAMVNFGHGEGFGLPLFEAASVGLPVITHDWGGQKDFLYAPKKNKKGAEKLRTHFTKVSYDLKPIQEEAVWDGVLERGTSWAFPHLGSCQIAMRDCFDNHGLYAGQAKRLKKWVLEEFSQEKINQKIVDLIQSDNSDDLGFDFEEITLEE